MKRACVATLDHAVPGSAPSRTFTPSGDIVIKLLRAKMVSEDIMLGKDSLRMTMAPTLRTEQEKDLAAPSVGIVLAARQRRAPKTEAERATGHTFRRSRGSRDGRRWGQARARRIQTVALVLQRE